MRFFKFILPFICGIALHISCKDRAEKIVQTEAIVFTKEGELSVFKKNTDSLLAQIDIEIADNDYETETGLMYRKTMQNHQAMLFVFAEEAMHSFYMKNTEFPLDLIFIKSNMHIASFQENTKVLDENSLSSKVPVQYVLEINAGLVKKWSLQIGDSIAYKKQ